MGMFTAVIGILLDNSSILMEILGFFNFYPLIIDFLLFLLGLIGSIGLLKNPRFEDSNPRKIAMIILASLPMILLLMFVLFL
jgi:predicted MFS family arabinose efflux permease